MSTAKAGAKGFRPKVKVEPIKKQPEIGKEYTVSKSVVESIIGKFSDERKKYIRCWDVPDYRKFSPGEKLVDYFLEIAKPEPGATIIDWGCGSGRAGKRLFEAGLDVTLLDFAYNCLDDEVRELVENDETGRIRFIEKDITEPDLKLSSEYGYCTDVFEHLPPEQIDAALSNVINCSRKVFFQISTVKDHFGNHPDIKKGDEPEHLHLTVWDYQTWLRKFVDQDVIIYNSNDLRNAVVFYVTGYGMIDWNNLVGNVNVSTEEIMANLKANAEFDIEPLQPHEPQDIEVMVLAGGPSLNDFEDEIREKRAAGMPMVTVNGTYNWALDRGLSPSLQFVIDAQEHNNRFVKQVDGLTDTTKYVIASQAHPSVTEKVPQDRSYLMQCTLDLAMEAEIGKLYGKKFDDWWPIPGGCTVTLRALSALQFLGFRKFHVYGLDSCVRPGEHHAYDQPENDPQQKKWVWVTLGKGTEHEKRFRCNGWHVMQANDFKNMAYRLFKDSDMIVYGDGLIAHWIRAAAELPDVDIDNIEET